MDGASLSLLQTGVWLIPLILTATIAGLYFLVRRWRQRSEGDLKSLRGRLRQLQGTLRQVQISAQDNTIEDPEPYGSLAAKLHANLEQLGQQLVKLEYEHVGLRERFQRLSANRWQSLVGAPYLWFELRKDIANLSSLLEEGQTALTNAGELESKLDRLGWYVALQARQARQVFDQVRERMDDLRDRRIQGETIDQAGQQVEEIHNMLVQIPSYFLVADESNLLEQADKESITRVHEITLAAQPALEELRSQAMGWQEMFAKTSEKVTRMSQVVDGVEYSLDRVPSEVQVSQVKARFESIKVVARTLRDSLSRLEIDNMELVAQEAERIANSAHEIETSLKRAGEQQATLEIVIEEYTGGLKSLSMQFASLGTRSTHPVIWGPSVATLTELNRAANEIGPPKKMRTPEQIKKDLVQAARLNSRQKELGEYCQSVEAQHRELVGLLAETQLSQMDRWLEDAQELARQTGQYAPENWPRGDSVASLPGEIDDLTQLSKSLLPKSHGQSIRESELSEQLQSTRELLEQQQKLQKRLENIRARLAELKEGEKEAQENLKTVQTVLNQIAHVVRSNSFLSDVAGKELEQLQADIQGALGDFQERQRGAMDKKVRQTNAITAKAEQSANRWLDQLAKEGQKGSETISTALAALDKIAMLDESAVADGRRLLAAGQSHQARAYAGLSRFRLEELVAEFKSRSDYWQACTAVASALSDVLGPVMGSYQDAEQSRQETQDLLARVSTWLQQNRDWPPTSISLKSEQSELERLEEQWSALKGRPQKAINLVQQLGNLSAKYQTLAAKINQSAERAEHEQGQIEGVELDINEAAQLWQNHWYTYREYPEISQEIRDLLDGIDHELAQIRRYYKQKTSDYQQVLQAMKNLYRKVRYYQVALDEEHAIDYSGQVHTKR